MAIRQVLGTESRGLASWLRIGVIAVCVAGCGGGGGGGGGGSAPPVTLTANAGANRVADENTTITLTGTGSAPGGGALTYAWTQVSGPQAEVLAPSAATTDVVIPHVPIDTAPTVVLRISVTDDTGATATDEVSIVVNSKDYLVFIADKDIDEAHELFVYETARGGTRKLNGPLIADGDVSSFKISPDGKAVAYVADQLIDNSHALFVARLDGSAVTKVSDTGIDGYVFDYEWSPDSTRLLYTEDASIDQLAVKEIYLVAPDGANRQKISGSTVNDTFYFDYARWSPDGRYVSYVAVEASAANVVGIQIYDLQAGTPNDVRITPSGLLSPKSSFRYQWSPDSDRIAYIDGTGSVGLRQLFVVTPDGSSLKRVSYVFPLGLVGVGEDVETMEWSPDGTLLAYLARDSSLGASALMELYTVAPDSSRRIQVSGTPHAAVRSFQWAPRGMRLAYDEAGPALGSVAGLYTVNQDGSARSQPDAALLRTAAGVRRYSWSPNSERIAFRVEIFGSGSELYTADDVAPNPTRVDAMTAASDFVASYEWLPDGVTLAYVGGPGPTDGFYELYSASASGSNPRKIGGRVAITTLDEDFVFASVDRSRLAVVSGAGPADAQITLMAPDGTGSMIISEPMVPGGAVATFPPLVAWSP